MIAEWNRDHRIKISNRRATQRCNVSAFFYAKICSLLARRRSSQPVQRVYWPENVIDWLGKWRPTCVMRHARGQKLQSFRRKWPFYMNLYSMAGTTPDLTKRFTLFTKIKSIKVSEVLVFLVGSSIYCVKSSVREKLSNACLCFLAEVEFGIKFTLKSPQLATSDLSRSMTDILPCR